MPLTPDTDPADRLPRAQSRGGGPRRIDKDGRIDKDDRIEDEAPETPPTEPPPVPISEPPPPPDDKRGPYVVAP